MNGSPSHSQSPHHRQNQLHKISDHNGPKATGHRVHEDQQSHDHQQQHRVGKTAECWHGLIGHNPQRLHHLSHGQKRITDADAIDRKGQQKGFRAPQPSRRRSSVAEFCKGCVCHHAAAAPKRSKHHSHRHMSKTEPPPLPIRCQASSAHQARDIQRCIDRESSGSHRSACQPTTQAASSNEIIIFPLIASSQPKPKKQGSN